MTTVYTTVESVNKDNEVIVRVLWTVQGSASGQYVAGEFPENMPLADVAAMLSSMAAAITAAAPV
jgi:hypothetical protein